MASQFDIQSMVEKPTWKEMLLELIDQNKIDPWDVDIVLISDAFMKKVKEMKKLDLAIQANVILAAAILLKYKSQYLRYLTMEEEVIEAYAPPDEAEIANDELPQLVLVSRIPPKRQVTLDELLDEMDKVIKYDTTERQIIPRGSVRETIDFEISEEDIEKRMNDVLERIRQNSDETGWSLFSSILQEKNSREIIYTLISLLHLTQMKEVDIRQDKAFGEIFIYLIEKEKIKIENRIRR